MTLTITAAARCKDCAFVRRNDENALVLEKAQRHLRRHHNHEITISLYTSWTSGEDTSA